MTRTSHSYFVVMIDYGKSREAIVNPEITRREVVSRLRSGEYPIDRVSFIHHVNGANVSNVTDEILSEAAARALRNEGVG